MEKFAYCALKNFVGDEREPDKMAALYLAYANTALWNHYTGAAEEASSAEAAPLTWSAYSELTANICYLDQIGKATVSESILYIQNHLPAGPQIIADLDADMIRQEADIRKDYAKAFRKVKNGSELSGILGWRLGKEDLRQFGTLHKVNRCRRKIEELLTDCNFHHECSLLHARNYQDYFKELDTNE